MKTRGCSRRGRESESESESGEKRRTDFPAAAHHTAAAALRGQNSRAPSPVKGLLLSHKTERAKLNCAEEVLGARKEAALVTHPTSAGVIRASADSVAGQN